MANIKVSDINAKIARLEARGFHPLTEFATIQQENSRIINKDGRIFTFEEANARLENLNKNRQGNQKYSLMSKEEYQGLVNSFYNQHSKLLTISGAREQFYNKAQGIVNYFQETPFADYEEDYEILSNVENIRRYSVNQLREIFNLANELMKDASGNTMDSSDGRYYDALETAFLINRRYISKGKGKGYGAREFVNAVKQGRINDLLAVLGE